MYDGKEEEISDKLKIFNLNFVELGDKIINAIIGNYDPIIFLKNSNHVIHI